MRTTNIFVCYFSNSVYGDGGYGLEGRNVLSQAGAQAGVQAGLQGIYADDTIDR